MSSFVNTKEVEVAGSLELAGRLAAYSVLGKLSRLEGGAVGVVYRVDDQLRSVPVADPVFTISRSVLDFRLL